MHVRSSQGVGGSERVTPLPEDCEASLGAVSVPGRSELLAILSEEA